MCACISKDICTNTFEKFQREFPQNKNKKHIIITKKKQKKQKGKTYTSINVGQWWKIGWKNYFRFYRRRAAAKIITGRKRKIFLNLSPSNKTASLQQTHTDIYIIISLSHSLFYICNNIEWLWHARMLFGYGEKQNRFSSRSFSFLMRICCCCYYLLLLHFHLHFSIVERNALHIVTFTFSGVKNMCI